MLTYARIQGVRVLSEYDFAYLSLLGTLGVSDYCLFIRFRLPNIPTQVPAYPCGTNRLV
jgi:hypothetical protein